MCSICKKYCYSNTKQCYNEIFVNKQYIIRILVIKRDVMRFFVKQDQYKKSHSKHVYGRISHTKTHSLNNELMRFSKIEGLSLSLESFCPIIIC